MPFSFQITDFSGWLNKDRRITIHSYKREEKNKIEKDSFKKNEHIRFFGGKRNSEIRFISKMKII